MLETQKRIGALMEKGTIEKIVFKDNGDIKAWIRYGVSPICVKDLESLADTAESLDILPTVSEKRRLSVLLRLALLFCIPLILALFMQGDPLNSLLACLSGLIASFFMLLYLYGIVSQLITKKP